MSTRISLDNTKVSSSTDYPQQVDMKVKEIVPVNFFEKRLLKHKPRSHFETYSALLYAASLESNIEVMEYVPRPFKLRVGQRYFIPSFFVRSLQANEIINLKESTELSAQDFIMKEYFETLGYQYSNVDISAVHQKQIRWENWLRIIQYLYLYREITTAHLEKEILASVVNDKQCCVDDIMKRRGSDDEQNWLLAIYSMAYRGHLKLDLDLNPISFSTIVSL